MISNGGIIMTVTRQDAWTEDDDLLLAEVTLRHIREGGTQLAAFEEVGEKLNRTAAACGFRWNSLIRKKYEAAIQIAKAQRKQRIQKRVIKKLNTEFSQELDDSESKEEMEESISYDSIIRFLKKQKLQTTDASKQFRKYEKEIEEKSSEIEGLRRENKELREKVHDLESNYQVVNEDYKSLIKIMDRARKMAFLADEEEEKKRVFKMDANGNLERIDK